ncbi:hypothetical protein KC367_g152 [Hortaea werneckii]|nr:hypothetical protein KC367_g152 [Hortaea werneckii]
MIVGVVSSVDCVPWRAIIISQALLLDFARTFLRGARIPRYLTVSELLIAGSLARTWMGEESAKVRLSAGTADRVLRSWSSGPADVWEGDRRSGLASFCFAPTL